MESYIYWMLLALILVGLELITATFYLLVVAIAMAVGGLVAYLGANSIIQLLFCALTCMSGILILRRWKKTQEAGKSPDASFDIGQSVKIIKWNDNGTARVFYRGAEWDAETEETDTPHDTQLYIASMRGSGLVLTHRKSQQ